ncbi:DUF58 domain-containing protein [Yinghuangia soli]|uniref:DUF58 domain-containing protein n=1 Tax=Yinghuangia soli TaxID=2908204 RepID=UPI001F42A1F1|nr:DUF58 domain-containing protein [Yinghuangia soli]
MSVLLLGAAWPLGYPEAAILGGTGLIAVALSVLRVLPARRVSAERTVVPARVARGEAAEAVVTATGRGRRGVRGVDMEDLCGGIVVAVRTGALRPGETSTAAYPLPTHRRGRLAVGPLRTVRTDLFGLARRARRCAADTSVLVRPRVHPLPLLASGRAHHIEGPSSANADGGSQAFHTLRSYVTGDDLRRVHWRSSARTGELMVRHMVDVSMPHTTVVLDTRRSAYATEGEVGPPAGRLRDDEADPLGDADDAFELAVEAAASVARTALLTRFPLRLLTAAGTVLADSRRGVVPDELLDLLALVAFSDEASLAGAFDELDRTRAGGTLVVITGSGDLTGLEALARPAARFERIVLVRTGPQPGRGTDAPANAAEGHRPAGLSAAIPCLYVDSPQALVAAWQREAAR